MTTIGCLNGKAKIWFHFIISNVQPCKNQNEVILQKAALLHCILRGEQVDIAPLIADSMYDMAHNKKAKGALGHASLIHHLCVAAGVEISEEVMKVELHPPIDAAFITKALPDQPAEAAIPTQMHRRQQGIPALWDAMDTLIQRQEVTDTRVGFLSQKMSHLLDQQTAYQTYMADQMAFLCQARRDGPPPFVPAPYPGAAAEEAFEAAQTAAADAADIAAAAADDEESEEEDDAEDDVAEGEEDEMETDDSDDD